MPKTNALNELISSTQPVINANTMPASAPCECQDCPEHEDAPCENVLESAATGTGTGGYLVERAGYSCIDCLPMMIEIGLAMTADSIEPTPGEPTYVRVANFESGTPTFRS